MPRGRALGTGFELPGLGLTVLADGDVFPEEVHLHARRRRGVRSFLSDFRDLKIGDLVVHQDHGIGRFMGLETIEVGGAPHEFMVIGYQGGDKLKVPVETFDRVQKYASAEGARPVVDKLGSGNWDKVKKRVKKAMRDMAAELLKLYAERKARPGHAFAGESPWQHEFEEAFEYEETPDQAAAIADVAADMADSTPMDRLICGDVGYGKTEVAMRAAMRAVLDGKQVAVLAPTTILAFQHWKTFRKRFAPFPGDGRDGLALPQPEGDQDRPQAGGRGLGGRPHRHPPPALEGRALPRPRPPDRRRGAALRRRGQGEAQADQELGGRPHPLRHPDPAHPADGPGGDPRHVGDRDPAQGPPGHPDLDREVLDRRHRVRHPPGARPRRPGLLRPQPRGVDLRAGRLVQKLVPEARVAVAHGQMPEGELEKAMLAFVEGRADVLVATTIIENGLDIPRANTMIVNRADRYGLAQLYQLRGRVGRSDRRAYAYLLVPPDTVLSEIARKRLAAIREFSDLGAGFRIAALDLELRGAGNLLGGEQSGHIEAVGLDLYVKLLEQTILELKGQAPREAARTTLNLRVDLRIPEEYVPEVHQRMSLYKRVSQVRDAAEVAKLAEEIRDRYGPFPAELDGLLGYAALRLRAEALGILQVDLGASALHLRLAPETPLGGATLAAAVRSWPGASLSPAGVLRAPLAAGAPALPALGAVLEALEGVLQGSPAAHV